MTKQDLYFRPTICGIYMYRRDADDAPGDTPVKCELYLESLSLGTWTGTYNEETKQYKFEPNPLIDVAKLKSEIKSQIAETDFEPQDPLDYLVSLLLELSTDYDSYEILKKENNIENESLEGKILVITYYKGMRKGFFIKNDRDLDKESILNLCAKFVKEIYGVFKSRKVEFRYYMDLQEFQDGEPIVLNNILKGE